MTKRHLEEDLLEKAKPRYSKRTKKQFKKTDLLYIKNVKDHLDAEEKERIDKLYKVNTKKQWERLMSRQSDVPSLIRSDPPNRLRKISHGYETSN
jgi:hypothetical protein